MAVSITRDYVHSMDVYDYIVRAAKELIKHKKLQIAVRNIASKANPSFNTYNTFSFNYTIEFTFDHNIEVSMDFLEDDFDAYVICDIDDELKISNTVSPEDKVTARLMYILWMLHKKLTDPDYALSTKDNNFFLYRLNNITRIL